MPIETIVAHHAIENKHAIDKRSPIGNWEIYSWGDGNFPGMAAISAITALQIGATLSPVPADKVALNKAAEYLLDALASQLKSFHQALNARADRANDERTRSYPSLSQRIGPGCSGRVKQVAANVQNQSETARCDRPDSLHRFGAMRPLKIK